MTRTCSVFRFPCIGIFYWNVGYDELSFCYSNPTFLTNRSFVFGRVSHNLGSVIEFVQMRVFSTWISGSIWKKQATNILTGKTPVRSIFIEATEKNKVSFAACEGCLSSDIFTSGQVFQYFYMPQVQFRRLRTKKMFLIKKSSINNLYITLNK